MNKVALIILDGFGINDKTPTENAITKANAPTLHTLFSKLKTKLDASARAVGLPDGQMGNSEVGHMTIGIGRIIKQNLIEIQDSIDEGRLAKLPEFVAGIKHCQENGSNLHILQLFGPGGVHAMDTHLISLLPSLPSDINVFLHLFSDGRDLDPRSALDLMKTFEETLTKFPNVKIASLAGRYFGMDRDNNRERIQKAYDEIMYGQRQTNDTPSEYIAKCYEQGINDEFIEPVSFMEGEQIESDDAIFFFNFRSDRARQMAQAITISMDRAEGRKYATRNNAFPTKVLRNVYFATMTKYYKEYTGPIFIKESDIKNTLGEVISKAEGRQLHLAETEKFAHVTKFFNGDKQVVYNGEKDILVPSHKVSTYDLDPEMSAQEIYDQFEEHAKDVDFTILNFANGDMVGHTGSMPAAIIAVEKLDAIIAQMIVYAQKHKIHLLITADHGNCEEMGTPEAPKTSHTTEPVPFRYILDGEVQTSKAKGGLSDLAPTVLTLMGLAIPAEMTGKNLVE